MNNMQAAVMSLEMLILSLLRRNRLTKGLHIWIDQSF